MTMNKLEQFTIKKLGPLRLSALLERVEKLVTKYRNYSARNVLEAKRDIAVATFPKEHREMAKKILDNQIESILISAKPTDTQNMQHLTFATAVHTIKAYQFLSNIVSIQPMKGPVDVIHQLKYTCSEGDKLALSVTTQAIEAGAKRYAAKLDLSSFEDSKFYRLDVEEEFSKLLGSEFACEIVYDTIEALCRYAIKHENIYDSVEGAICELNRAAGEIATTTRRGAGNVLVMNPVTLQALTEAHSSMWTPSTEPTTLDAYGISYAGKLYYYDVYVNYNPELSDYKVLVGYLGRTKTSSGEPNSFIIDAGVTVAPYVPVVSTGVIINPDTYEPEYRYMCRSGMAAMLTDISWSKIDVHKFDGKNYYRMVDLSTLLDTEK